ncbi:MAG: hypothetical protein IT363_02060 [Methanoregulaceae archaeon]|nr:hypothetical protein [Methanoregulaceae archaeon]
MPLDLTDVTKLLESRRRERARSKVAAADPIEVRRCLGLEPLPPRTDLHLQQILRTGFEGYVVERWQFESQPGVVVPLSVYRPAADGPHYAIVYAADAWGDGRNAEWAQSFGIALALHGFVTLAIDPPGVSDRAAMGDRNDPTLSDAAPALGVYVWDLLRTLDVVAALDGLLIERVGLTGAGYGGDAALLASVLDERFYAVAVTGCGHCQETHVAGAFTSVPGLSELGDWAHLLAVRAPRPLSLMVAEEDDPAGVEATHKKLSGSYRRSEASLTWTRFLGARDYTRRMREVAAAFFRHHLQGESSAPYAVELRPLTDSATNPYPAGTVSAEHLSQPVGTAGFLELRRTALAKPYPGKDPELRAWGKHGRVEPPEAAEALRLVDAGEATGVTVLPTLPDSALIASGLSAPEFYAQVLHLLLPGGPEGWEPLALTGDSLSAVIASVRTLMKASDPPPIVKSIEAEGPLASLTAKFFTRHRPGVTIRTTHDVRSWEEVASLGLLVPGARYRPWPWPGESVAPPVPIEEPGEASPMLFEDSERGAPSWAEADVPPAPAPDDDTTA